MKHSTPQGKLTPPRTAVSVSISLDEVDEVNEAAHGRRLSRSEFMREAALKEARRINRKATAGAA